MDSQFSLDSDSVCFAYPDQPLATTLDTALGDVLRLLRAQKTGAVLVCDGAKLVGIVTERDLLKFMSDGTDLSQPVSKVMSTPPVTIDSSASVSDAIAKMSEGGYRHLPIVDESGTPTGVLAVNGIVHYLVDHFPEAVYNLPPNPKSVPSEREGA